MWRRRRSLAVALLTALLLGPVVRADEQDALNDQEPSAEVLVQVKKQDDTLLQELQLVEEAQKARTLNLSSVLALKVNSSIVPEAPKAILWGGDADITTTGACQQDIDRHCLMVVPGEGRLAACLSSQIAMQRAGNVAEDQWVSEACHEELFAFKADRATNLNKNVRLAFACRRDIRKHCRPKRAGSDPALIMDCLREKLDELSERCAQEVRADDQEVAADLRLDVPLRDACANDAESLCADVDADDEGALTECLVTNRAQVSTLCQEQLARWERQRAGDVRLDRHLFRACSADMAEFCPTVEMGQGRMEECLQDHRQDDAFSERCRSALEERMERAAADYTLNWGLREYCASDIEELCDEQRVQIEMAEGYGADSQVITCLETQRERIKGARCREEVHRQLQHEAEDLRFDHALAKACHRDVKLMCTGVVPGSARVIHCLQEHRARLTDECSTQLFDHEVMLAEDIDFIYPLRRACMVEVDLLCAGVPHGHAHVIQCLRNNIGHDEMSVECGHMVHEHIMASSMDWRFHSRLLQACQYDATTVCKDKVNACAGEECKGAVLDCLRDRMEELHSEECRNEVFAVVRMQAADYLNDAQTVAACAEDVALLCPAVQSGDVHACLRENMRRLSRECQAREAALSVIQARDIRLQPRVVAACGEEMAVLCSGVPPGQGRMQRCLIESMGKPGLGLLCREEVTKLQLAAQLDYRRDYGLFSTCRVDAEALCGEELEGGPWGPRRALGCLINRFKLLAEPCRNELQRFVRLALWNYQQGAGLTRVCDADVQARCRAASKQQHSVPTRPGLVGRCLAKQVAQGNKLSERCRRLVLAAAPRDVRTMFDRGMTLEAVAGRVAQIAHAAGLSSTFVDQNSRGLHAITVTGWVAFACVASMVMSVLGMLSFAVWRWSCAPRQRRYAPVGDFKEGDV